MIQSKLSNPSLLMGQEIETLSKEIRELKMGSDFLAKIKAENIEAWNYVDSLDHNLLKPLTAIIAASGLSDFKVDIVSTIFGACVGGAALILAGGVRSQLHEYMMLTSGKVDISFKEHFSKNLSTEEQESIKNAIKNYIPESGNNFNLAEAKNKLNKIEGQREALLNVQLASRTDLGKELPLNIWKTIGHLTNQL